VAFSDLRTATEQAGGNTELESWLSVSPAHPSSAEEQPWIAAYIDLPFAGQTQVWLFASWEATSSPPQSSLAREHLLRTLFQYINSFLIPELSTSPPKDFLMLEASGKLLSKPYSRNKVLFGTVNIILSPYFRQEWRTRDDTDYHKYIFHITRSTTSLAEPAPLPEGYQFVPLRDQDLQVVLDRTNIPRTMKTLRSLPSLGVSHTNNPTPIAWGFLGKDASLSSLHTEPAHRGRGIAVGLGQELLKMADWAGNESGEGSRANESANEFFANADVSTSNAASRRVMEKLGGQPLWKVMWVEIDMAKAISDIS
jgi:GNAT superfamily N-acetyltransferase